MAKIEISSGDTITISNIQSIAVDGIMDTGLAEQGRAERRMRIRDVFGNSCTVILQTAPLEKEIQGGRPEHLEFFFKARGY